MAVSLGGWLVVCWYRHRDLPHSPWFLRAAALSGVGAVLAMEAGWVVTEISDELWLQRPFGAAFAASSLITPFFVGTVAGAVASRRVPPNMTDGDIVASLGLLTAQRYLLVRITAALAVTAVIRVGARPSTRCCCQGCRWRPRQADPAVLTACLWALGIGSLLLVPSLLYLFVTSALVIVGWPG